MIGLAVCVAVIALAVVLAPLKPIQVKRYLPLAEQVAALYQLDVALLLAVANVESSFDPNAVSSAGAVGIMQLMPATAMWICRSRALPYSETSLFDPLVSLDLGAWYLRYLLQKFDLAYALCAYNAGEGVVSDWIDKGIAATDSPYPETRQYVERVLRYRRHYHRFLGDHSDTL